MEYNNWIHFVHSENRGENRKWDFNLIKKKYLKENNISF
jgi:hypothetical protein